MAQIIKNRRGSLDRLSSATGSLQKGEILIATGSSKLTGVTNGQGLVFAAVESGSVVAANRVLQGAVAPIFSASSYGHMLDGVPFYASSSNTLFLLGADGNTTPDLTGNISTFSSSVATSFSASAASIASVTGDFSSSVATSFSASAASVTALSASTYHAVFGFGELSSSIATDISASNHITSDLSASVATSFSASAASQTLLSASIATTDSASAYQISQLSASVASVGGTFSSSVATDFSASKASQTALSASVNTRFGVIESTFATTGSNTFVGNQIVSGTFELAHSSSTFKIEGNGFSQTYLTSNGTIVLNPGYGGVEMVGSNRSFKATNITAEGTLSASVITGIGNVTDYSSSVNSRFSASTFDVSVLSASVASVGGTFSSSVATDFSASTAARVALSASVDTRIKGIEFLDTTFATTGSNTFSGSQVVSGSLWVTGDVTIYGSSSLVNVTASAVTLGTNTIVLNTANPAVRFGGIQVIDSGSAQSTGSLYWDSTNNVWLYANPTGAGYGSARLIAGPQNTGSLGQEIGLTTTYVPVAVGDDHIGDSNVKVIGNEVTIESGSLYVEGAISASTIDGIGNVSEFSSSVATQFSSSVYNVAELSASVASVGGTFSSSVATDFSASNAARVALSASVATDFSASAASITNVSASVSASVSSVSGAFATSTSASNAEIAALSASVASVGGTFSSSVATSFSASYANVTALSSSVASDLNTLSQSIATNAFLDSTYATTGSNIFHGDQTITGSLDTTGTVNFNNAVAVNDSNMNLGNSSSLNLTGGSSIYVAGAGTISGSIVGIGNVSLYSASVDTRFSASTFDISVLSASVASVGGTFSSSVATDFSASNAARVALSQSVYDTLYWPTTGLSASLSSGSQYQVNIFSASISNEIFGVSGFSSSVSSSLGVLSGSISSSISTLSSSVSQSIYETIFSGTNPFSLSSSFASASAAYSSSAATFVSESIYQTIFFPSTGLSASIATTDSASAFKANELSSSVSSISGAFATSVSESNYNISTLSASVASVAGTFSSSVASRLTTIETTYATTGSNSFTGSQGILGDVIVSGSLFIEFGQDLVSNHISGNQGRIELGNTDANIHIIADNELFLTATGSGVHVHNTNFSVAPAGTDVLVVSQSITKVTNEFSASNISGVGNIGVFSQSVDSRLQSLVQFENSASTALEFTGSSLTVIGDLTVRGTTTSVNSTTVDLGTNIVSLNGSAAALAGLRVNDATNPSKISGSLLWDSTNDYWIAGKSGSEAKVLVAVGDNVFSSSIQTALSGTFGYSDFSSSIATNFSASAASIASVTGDFSSSVATSFSQSAFTVSQLSASVASVTGDFSSSVATSFSASAFVVSTLSSSIYLTDATQSAAISDNSGSFATSISASNFRITILETTIDGGSF